MCGILALVTNQSVDVDDKVFDNALDQMVHRGPDGRGTWLDRENHIYLGHRRLSVLDLSTSGSQPMKSQNGRWVITFNGEIYNFAELKQQLIQKGVCFNSGTDTEVLVECINLWGVEVTLGKTVGMFAFAVWDRETKQLVIARDRLGEKPCYCAKTSTGWVIASELKAITAFSFFERRVDPKSVQLYLHHKYVPEPLSIYSNVKKLRPGCYAVIKQDQSFEETPYWSFVDCVEQGQRNPVSITEDEAADQLDCLLKAAINLQKVADVPVGAFLSGGIDSSLVVAVMQSIEGKPVHTFSIGFEDAAFDEAPYARKVAAHLNTHHTELIVTPSETRDVLPKLCSIYDEPFADSSSIPTILVSQLARKQVTVSLSGDAGDELFGGYTRYRQVDKAWKRLQSIYSPIKELAAFIATHSKTAAWTANQFPLFHWLLMKERQASPKSFAEAYHGHMTSYQMINAFLEAPVEDSIEPGVPDWLSNYHHGMAADVMNYLPSDILTKVDRAAMSTSLETRVPLLDHRIVEWAWSLPEALKVDEAVGKKVMRNLLHRYAPRELFERPKKGFGVPVGHWVRHELRDWADHLMSAESLRSSGVFHPKKITAFWQAHRDGRLDEPYAIWPVIMLQAWMEEHKAAL